VLLDRSVQSSRAAIDRALVLTATQCQEDAVPLTTSRVSGPPATTTASVNSTINQLNIIYCFIHNIITQIILVVKLIVNFASTLSIIIGKLVNVVSMLFFNNNNRTYSSNQPKLVYQ